MLHKLGMVAHACNSSGGCSRIRSSTSSCYHWVQSQPGWPANESSSQKKKQESVVILSTYQLLLYMTCVWHVCVVMHAVHMCMITEQLCGVQFLLPPLWRFSEIKLRSSGLYATTITHWAILPAPNLVWWHPLEQTAWLAPSFSTKYELWTLAILEQCKM